MQCRAKPYDLLKGIKHSEQMALERESAEGLVTAKLKPVTRHEMKEEASATNNGRSALRRGHLFTNESPVPMGWKTCKNVCLDNSSPFKWQGNALQRTSFPMKPR